MQALYWKKVAVRGEGHASATGHGMSPAQLLHDNKELSKKRLDIVVNRLKKTIAEKDPHIVLETDLVAAGADGAPPGVEDDYWRRVAISIDGDDLKKAINDIYKREFGGTSPRSFKVDYRDSLDTSCRTSIRSVGKQFCDDHRSVRRA